MLGIQKGLYRCLSEAVLSGMRPLLIVLLQPVIDVGLQILDRTIQPLTKGHAIELILHRAMKSFTDTVGLGRVSLGSGMIDILHRKVELVFVMFAVAAILGSTIGQDT